MSNPRTISGLWTVIVLSLMAVLAAGCGNHGSAGAGGASSSTILIGEYGSATGDQSTFGVSTHKGITMAVDEVNAAGGINGKKLEDRFYDDESKPDEAKTAVTKLVEQDNVTAVLGEVASSNSKAAAPVCQKNKVPMISPASTNVAVTQIGDYIFRTCFIDPFQGAVTATFAYNNLHARKAAIFKETTSAYSIGLADAFRATFTKLGGKIVSEESYSKDDVQFDTQLAAIKQSAPDVVFIPGYYSQVGLIARQARNDVSLTVPFIGGDGWDSPKLFESAGPNLEGCYFSNHYSVDSSDPNVAKFVKAYGVRNNGDKPDAMAALAYDAAHILAQAMITAGKPADGDYTSDAYRAKLRDAIAGTKDYVGVTGTITIGPDRNAIKPAVILQIHGQGYKYITSIKP